MIGFVYILVNETFPHLVKIGYADNVQNRLKSLNNSSGLPMGFCVYATYQVNARLEDKKIHEIIDTLDPSLRYNQKREFFEMSPEKAYRLFECIAMINGLEKNLRLNPFHDEYVQLLIDGKSRPVSHLAETSTGDSETENNKKSKTKSSSAESGTTKKRKPSFSFALVGIPAGSELSYTEKIFTKVYVATDQKRLIYKGIEYTLTELLLKLTGKKISTNDATHYFKFKGKLLSDIREELEV